MRIKILDSFLLLFDQISNLELDLYHFRSCLEDVIFWGMREKDASCSILQKDSIATV